MTLPHDLVLFDLDGTLSDPLAGIGRSINYALAHFGFPERQLHDLAIHIGPPLDIAFKSLTGSEAPGVIAGLVAKYRERYGDLGYAENELYAGIPEALQCLSEAGMPMGVCTSKRADFAEKILAMFELRAHFRFVSGGEVGIEKSQQIAALLQQGLATKAAVMVGDRAVDLRAAHRNGLRSAGVLWGHGSRAELEAENPSHLFSAPCELAAFVREGLQTSG